MSQPPIRFGVGVESLNKLAADLRRAADKELVAGIRVAFKKGGDRVRDKARQNFAWSKRIPRTVNTFMPFGGITKVQVKAGGARAPHAAAFENQGRPGTFRHPVFGNRQVWVNQQARPGLLPALQSEIEPVLDDVIKGIDQAFKEAGAR